MPGFILLFIKTMQKIVHSLDGRIVDSIPARRGSFSLRKITFLVTILTVLLIGATAGSVNAASAFWKNFVILNYGGADIYYKTVAPSEVPNIPFQNNNLGTIDRGNGIITLAGGETNTYQNDGDDITATRMYYRVYRQGNTPTTAFVPIELGFISRASNGDKIWRRTGSEINLLASVGENGNYVLEVYFVGDGNKPGFGDFTIYDSNNGGNYRATFTVQGNAPTIWNGSQSTDWFNAANWSNGVPNPDTDAVIPTLPNGSSPVRFPNLKDEGGVAQTRNLLIDGLNGIDRGLLSLNAGRLEIYGDFRNPTSGYEQGEGLFVLAKYGDQSFDGDVFTQISIAGSGNKTLTNRMDVQVNLLFNGGILVTNTANATQFNVTMLGAGIIGAQNGQQQETETSYLSGYLVARRSIGSNGTTSFGNVGVTLTATGIGTGETLVTRLTSLAYSNVGDGQYPSIKRSFNLVAANNTDLDVKLDFRYLQVELNGLRESNLALYRSDNTGVSFIRMGRDDVPNNPNLTTKTLTKSNLTTLGLFTLSESVAPLPVALTSLTATRQGTNALVSWTTAQEVDNSGFDVQVSTDGKEFRTLATVPAVSANSSTGHAYQYRDTEAGKLGLRYYRLRQVDLDGTATFYGPRSVAFDQEFVKLEVAPNPFSSVVTLTTQSGVAGNAVLRLVDMNGRVVREQALAVSQGVSALPLSNLESLTSGVYFVQLTLPDGQVQRQKVLKN